MTVQTTDAISGRWTAMEPNMVEVPRATATILDWIDGRPHHVLEDAVAATVTPTPPPFDHYEKPEHVRSPPPGIPFGYILEVTTCTCGGCGRKEQTTRVLQVARAGFGNASLGVGISTPIYDRPIKRVNRTTGTPVCLWCINDLRPEPVHYPVPGAAVGRSKAMANADATSAKRPVVLTKAADVADDFL